MDRLLIFTCTESVGCSHNFLLIGENLFSFAEKSFKSWRPNKSVPVNTSLEASATHYDPVCFDVKGEKYYCDWKFSLPCFPISVVAFHEIKGF